MRALTIASLLKLAACGANSAPVAVPGNTGAADAATGGATGGTVPVTRAPSGTRADAGVATGATATGATIGACVAIVPTSATGGSGCPAAALSGAVPAPAIEPIKPAPPYAPRPAIKPLRKLPVARPVAAPTPRPAVKAELNKPTPAGPSAAPATIGRIARRKPASGRPVSGLVVSVPPCARASA